jgi:hypothetical protein
VVPVLEKAPDFCINSARAEIPFLVPRISGRAMYLDVFCRIFRCWLYLGHSASMWFLVSRVSLSQGHAVGSGESGKKDLRKSPV